MKTILISMILALSFAAIAEEVGPNHPCKEVKAACEAAGYHKGGHKEGKGLWMDCLEKLKAGAAVPGVTVAADKLAACKAKNCSNR